MKPRQERFCQLIASGRYSDPEKAAIEAGYHEFSARVQGKELMQSPAVKRRIQDLQNEFAQSMKITPQRVLAEMAKIAFVNVRDVVDHTGQLRNPLDIPEEAWAAVAGLEETPLGTRVKFYDKKAALTELMKYLGLNKERIEVTGAISTETQFTVEFIAKEKNGREDTIDGVDYERLGSKDEKDTEGRKDHREPYCVN